MKIQHHRIDTNVVVGLLVREFCCSGTDVSAKVLAMYADTRTPPMEPQWLAAGLSQNLKKASVFCTPSISAEYYHLEEIKEFNTDLIEMETASLFMADLLEIPTVALLVVSDNSATGIALVGRTEEEQRKYDYGRNVVLPTMILKIADA